MMNQSYHFSRLQELADHVKGLDKDTVLAFFDNYVAPMATKRRKLCVQVFAKQHVDKMVEENPPIDEGENIVVMIQDPAVFRRSMPLYPLPKVVELEVVKDMDCGSISL